MTDNNNDNNETLYFKVFRNQFIRTTIFNCIKEFNHRLKYTRYNYYDIPIESILNNKSMMLGKFRDHNNGKSKITFKMNWFNKLIDCKELDFELFQIVYSTFKHEIDIGVSQSCNTNQLILNGKLDILKVLDGIMYGEQQGECEYYINLPSKFYGQPNPIDDILSLEMLEYLVHVRNVKITKEYFNVSFTFISDRTDLVCHYYNYLEFLYTEIKRHQPNRKRDEIETSLLLLAIKTDDSRIYKLLFGYNPNKPKFIKRFGVTEELVQFCEGVNIRLVELEDFKNLNHLAMLCFIGEIRSKFQFDLFKLLTKDIPYTSYIIHAKLVDKGPLEYNTFNLLYDRVNGKLISYIDGLMTVHYSVNCLTDDLSNKHLFNDIDLTLYKSLEYSTQISIDSNNILLMEYLIEKKPHSYLIFNYYINSTTNQSHELIRKLFSNCSFQVGNELLCSIVQSKYKNIVDAVFSYSRSTLFTNQTQLIISLFKFMEIGSSRLFYKVFDIIKSTYLNPSTCLNDMIFQDNILKIYDYLDQNPLPVDPLKRSFFLSCLDTIFKFNQNGNNLFDSFIQFLINKKFSKINHSTVYLLNLSHQQCLKLSEKQSRKLIKRIIDSNNNCRIYNFIESIQLDLNFYIKYTIRKNHFSTLIQLIKLMPSSSLNEEYKIQKIIKYIFKFNNTNLLNYMLSIGQDYNGTNNFYYQEIVNQPSLSNFINFNYYLNYCHFQILINCTRKIEIPLIEYLYKINYKYSPTANITSEIYSIIPTETIDKISSTQTLFQFLDNIGLSQYFKKSNNTQDNQIIDNLQIKLNF